MRCYASRKLDESSERAEAEERLVAWLTAMIEPLIETFATSGKALDRLTTELQNLLAGLEVLRGTEDERQVLLASALVRCRPKESIAEARPLYERHEEPTRRAALTHTTGVLALLRDDPAREHLADALRLLKNSASVIQPYAIEGLAVSALRTGTTSADCG